MQNILVIAAFCLISLTVANPAKGAVGFLDGRIIGGVDAEPGEFPFVVSMQIKPYFQDQYHMCGGVIVNPTHVVTAAHCVEGQILSQVSIIAGAHNMKVFEPNQQVRYPKRLIWHDNFDNERLNHDAAVITLTEPFTFNQWVQPLNLSLEGFNHTGRDCLNMGWGNANPTGGTPIQIPDALQKINMTVVPRDECQELYNGMNVVDATMVCARGLDDDGYQGSCNGDSGSGLTCLDDTGNAYLAGIVSWGMNPCGQYRYPTVYADTGNKEVRDFLMLEAARP